MDLGVLEAALDRIESQLQRIATALESGASASGGGGGGGGGDKTGKCTKLPDGRFKWEILPHHKSSKCKYCGGEVYWFKAKSGKWVIVDPDGFSHRDRCGKAGNPVETTEPETNEEVPF